MHERIAKFIFLYLNSERQGKFISNIKMGKDNGRRKSSPAFSDGTLEWNDTTERYAVAISQVHHTRLAAYRWRNLKNIFKKCGVRLNTICPIVLNFNAEF